MADVMVDPKHSVWVKDFLDEAARSDEVAETGRKRQEVVDTEASRLGNARDGLAGLDFSMMVKADANLKSRLMAAFGKQDSMRSLTGTGDAMKEIDTFHDVKNLEAIDPETLRKAGESLRLVVESSQQVDAKLMALYATEAGLDPKDFERLQQALEKKRAAASDPIAKAKKRNGFEDDTPEDPELSKYEALCAKVDREVADEVWQPLVRQGLIPENMVPDKYSEVSRTFEAASELYDARLKKYTDEMGDNASLLEGLGIGKDIVDKSLKFTSELLAAVPGIDGAKDSIKTAFECSEILNSTAFDVAGHVIQKRDALDISQTIADGVGKMLSKVGAVPEAVTTAVTKGMTLAITSGRTVKALMDGNPQDALNQLASSLNQSLALAASISGNPDMALIAKTAGPMITGGPKAAIFLQIATTKPADPAAVKKAFGELVHDALTSLGEQLNNVVQAEQANGEVSKTDGKMIQDGMKIGIDGIGDLTDALLSDDKAGGLATAFGNLAGSCCSAYLPPEYGKIVGGTLKSVLGKGGQAFVKAVQANDPGAAIVVAVNDLLSTALKNASESKGLPKDIQQALLTASTGTAQLAGLKELAEAIKAGDPKRAQAALQAVFDEAMAPVYDEVDPAALGVGDEDDEAEEEDEGAAEGDPLAEESKEAARLEKEFNDKQRQIISAQSAIIDNPASKKDQVEKAKKLRDDAMTAILERATMNEEIEASSRDFAALLNTDLSAQPDGDDDGDTRTLETLINTIKRDRMVLQMADSMISMGITAAAHFIAPMGIATDFKKFAMEAAKAVSHLRELMIWKKNAGEARNAVTVQVHSMLNRVGLEKDAVIEHQMKATLALISAIGNVIATAGAHAAPAGLAITAAAKVASAALELALAVKSATEMEMAWRQFQKAMQEPRDRKNVRMAIQKNATLAKYALVWGALQDGNPIAKKALKRCNLTDKIIADEKANVDKVVGYLEVLYNDDPVVLRAVPDMSGWGWTAPKPAASLRVWTEFLATAQTKGKPKMMPGTGGAITAAFGAVEPAQQAVDKAKMAVTRVERFIAGQAGAVVITQGPASSAPPSPSDERRRKLLEAKLTAVAKDLAEKEAALAAAYKDVALAAMAMKPLDKDGKPYPRIAEWLDGLAAVCQVEIRKLDGEEIALEMEAA